MSRPDAVKIPDGHADHLGGDDRKRLLVELAEEALGIDPESDELAHVREQHGFHFASRDPDDTMLHPNGHVRAGQSRYRWTVGPDGIATGVLDVDADAHA